MYLRIVFLVFGFLLLAFSLTSCTNSELTRIKKEETQKIIQKAALSKIIILDVYHNRCESCKLIEPVLEELKSLYSKNNNILFLKYDLSNFFLALSSKKLAKKIGLEDIYNSQRYSGVVLIIDNKTKKVLDTLVAEYSLNKYIEAIEKGLNGNYSPP